MLFLFPGYFKFLSTLYKFADGWCISLIFCTIYTLFYFSLQLWIAHICLIYIYICVQEIYMYISISIYHEDFLNYYFNFCQQWFLTYFSWHEYKTFSHEYNTFWDDLHNMVVPPGTFYVSLNHMILSTISFLIELHGYYNLLGKLIHIWAYWAIVFWICES